VQVNELTDESKLQNILDQAVQYFKQEEYMRIFAKMRDKYASFGRCEGNIIIEKPSMKEKQALSGFMKRDYSKNKTITISLKKFESRIQETRFAGISLKQILEKYYGQPIISKKEEKQNVKNKQEEYFVKFLNTQKGTNAYKILEKIITEKSTTYTFWKAELLKQQTQINQTLEKSLQNACYCFNHLPKSKIKLPVFSSMQIKDPHGLDKNTQTGRIFTQLLANHKGIKYPQNAQQLSELYYEYNILIDDVSNMVLCKNIKAYVDGREHERLEGIF